MLWPLPRRLTWLVGLALLGAGHAAHAQTDSTATQGPDSAAVSGGGGLTPPPAGLPSAEFEKYGMAGSGVRYTAALTGLYTTGTVERVYFTTSHTGAWAVRHWEFPAAASYSYGRQSGQLKERELLLLVTPDYRLGKWKFYTLAEFQTSNLRAIDHRTVLGGGVGYQLYRHSAKGELAVSTFLLDETTYYAIEPPLERHVVRNSTRLKLHLNRGPLSASAQLFYQPAMQDPGGDYRLNNATVLAVKLYQHLALNVAFSYSYESVVVQNRSRANSTLSVGFAYSTGK